MLRKRAAAGVAPDRSSVAPQQPEVERRLVRPDGQKERIDVTPVARPVTVNGFVLVKRKTVEQWQP
jgi:hypothetical protein